MRPSSLFVAPVPSEHDGDAVMAVEVESTGSAADRADSDGSGGDGSVSLGESYNTVVVCDESVAESGDDGDEGDALSRVEAGDGDGVRSVGSIDLPDVVIDEPSSDQPLLETVALEDPSEPVGGTMPWLLSVGVSSHVHP